MPRSTSPASSAKGGSPTRYPRSRCRTTNPVHLPKLLVDAGLCPSTSDARRLIEQGAVRIDGDVAVELDVPRESLSQAVLQVGKRRFVRLT